MFYRMETWNVCNKVQTNRCQLCRFSIVDLLESDVGFISSTFSYGSNDLRHLAFCNVWRVDMLTTPLDKLTSHVSCQRSLDLDIMSRAYPVLVSICTHTSTTEPVASVQDRRLHIFGCCIFNHIYLVYVGPGALVTLFFSVTLNTMNRGEHVSAQLPTTKEATRVTC